MIPIFCGHIALHEGFVAITNAENDAKEKESGHYDDADRKLLAFLYDVLFLK